jgi:hypothetical protein
MPDDIGHGRVAISAFLDRGGQTVEQSTAEPRHGAGRLGNRCAHPSSLVNLWYERVPYILEWLVQSSTTSSLRGSP